MKNDKSMLDVAYDVLKEEGKELTFAELYSKVAAILEMDDEEKKAHIGKFYTDLTFDGRYVTLTDNTWDLRSRHTYDKVHMETGDAYSEEESGDVEEQEEEAEYDAEMQGRSIPSGMEEEDEEKRESDEELLTL